MTFKNKVREALKSINWNFGKGDIQKIKFDKQNPCGHVFRKMQYGKDNQYFSYIYKPVNKAVVSFLGKSRVIKLT